MALVAEIVGQALPRVDHLGVGHAGPAVPLEQRSSALEHHPGAYQEQVAADNQIQPIIEFICEINKSPISSAKRIIKKHRKLEKHNKEQTSGEINHHIINVQ